MDTAGSGHSEHSRNAVSRCGGPFRREDFRRARLVPRRPCERASGAVDHERNAFPADQRCLAILADRRSHDHGGELLQPVAWRIRTDPCGLTRWPCLRRFVNGDVWQEYRSGRAVLGTAARRREARAQAATRSGRWYSSGVNARSLGHAPYIVIPPSTTRSCPVM
jgi:hypothetical protein